MNWNSITKGFKAYLQLERSLSENSVDAYLRDIKPTPTGGIFKFCQRIRLEC